MAGKPKPQEEDSGEGAAAVDDFFRGYGITSYGVFCDANYLFVFRPEGIHKAAPVINATLAPDLYGGWLREQPLEEWGIKWWPPARVEKEVKSRL